MLVSSEAGLSAGEAARRLSLFGPNQPLQRVARQGLLRFAGNFTHTLALLLWFAAALAFAAGIPALGGAIVAVVAVNGVFAFVQEYRAARVIEALMRTVAIRSVVRRDGAERVLPSTDLVPGDVVRLAAGDVVPADCVLLSADELTLDVSVLTGESLPVERRAEALEDAPAARTPVMDLVPFAAAGSGVVTGGAEAIVCATGSASTIGEIAELVESVAQGASVLERQIADLSRFTAVLAVLAGSLTLVLAAATTDVEFIAALTFATGVIVALVPEGLLPTLSASLAIGAERMASRGAAVRRLSAVEVVGAATVICTDKTGTLTQNALSVVGFIDPAGGEDVPGEALTAAALCNDARTGGAGGNGDRIDLALLPWCAARGCDVDASRARHPRLRDHAFDALRRYMSVTVAGEEGEIEYVKGAPEAVLALMGRAADATLAERISAAAARGERLLMLARARAGAWLPLGVVRLHDPPRPEAAGAIAACQRAGIRVVMMTGDHPGTAQAVARMIGLGDGRTPVIDGAMIDAMSDVDLAAVLRADAVLARIDPRQKLRVTSVLKRAGEVVVMTGDGVNDAPALRAADVGVAMGLRGTEVAKQAADIVLSDDNFATIVAAIEEGRGIKSNIRRFASYVFTSNVAELAPFLLYIFLPVPLPLAIIQVLAIDLGTDLLPALALGTDRPSSAAMRRPPEPPTRPLITRALALRTFLFYGLVEAALGVAGFFAVYAVEGWRPFESLGAYAHVADEARTLTFLGIVSGQIGCVFAQRSGSLRSRLSLTSNRWMGAGLAFELVLSFLLVYVPGLNGVFEMTAVGVPWLLVLPAGAAVFLAIDLLRRRVEAALAHAP